MLGGTSLHCARCGGSNPAESFECHTCGSLFCRRCGAPCEQKARFCGQCAAPLAASGADTAERRQVTVLFCDLVGSSSLLEGVGAERFHQILREYHRRCEQAIVREGGYIAQPLGDGVLAYFGYPSTHEDAARRALVAALELVDSVERLSKQYDRALQARVGCDTGVVSVGHVAGPHPGDQLAVGEPVNRAARLQSLAEPNRVLISEATRRLTEGFFEFRALGEVELKGFTGKTSIHEVSRATEARGRLQAAAAAGLTPFVEQGTQAARLNELWSSTRTRAQVVLLTGDPGLGKSRHVLMLKDRAAADGALVLEALCSEPYRASPWHALADAIRSSLGFQALPGDAERLEVLRASLPPDAPEAALTLLAGALGLPPAAGYTPVPYLPQRVHAESIRAFVSWLVGRARQRSVLLVVEDLHWADQSTVEFLTALVRQEAGPSLMVLATSRPRVDHDPTFATFQATPGLVSLTLERLPRPAAESIVASITGGVALPAEVLAMILDRGSDTPLFLEEITKTVLTSGNLRLVDGHYQLIGGEASVNVPATLRDALMARLDLLGSSRALAHLAATIGREFTVDLLCSAAQRDEPAVNRDLARIEQAGIIQRLDGRPRPTYLFKHALIQQEAYDDLPSATRRAYHRDVARALSQAADAAHHQPQLLGYHHAQAGDPASALAAYAQAGQSSIAGSAYSEAASAFGSAVEQARLLPDSPIRDRTELDLAAALGFALLSTRGFSDKKVEQAYGRALELCERLGTEAPFRVLYGVWVYHLTHGGVAASEKITPWFESLVARSTDPDEQLAVNSVLGVAAFSKGDFRGVHRHLEAAVALIDRQDPGGHHIRLLQRHGYDSLLNSMLFLAWTQLIEGNPSASRAGIADALGLAAKSGNPYLIATAFSVAGSIAHHLSDAGAAHTYGDKLMKLAEENHFLYWTGGALCALGWSACHVGSVDQGLPLVQQSVALFRAMGDSYVLPYYLSYLVETDLRAGRFEGAAATIEECIRLAEGSGTLVMLAEFKRLQGEAALGRGLIEDAEDRFRLAIALARVQGAHLLELRAAISLARLLALKGRGAEGLAQLERSWRVISQPFDLPEGREVEELLLSLRTGSGALEDPERKGLEKTSIA